MKRGTPAWRARAGRYLDARVSPPACRPILLRRVDLSEDDFARGQGRRVPKRRRGVWRRRIAPRGYFRGAWTEVLS